MKAAVEAVGKWETCFWLSTFPSACFRRNCGISTVLFLERFWFWRQTAGTDTLNSGWQTVGSWTVAGPTGVLSVGVIPSTVTLGPTQTHQFFATVFASKFRHCYDGATSALVRALLLINASVTGLLRLCLGLALQFRISTTLGWVSAISIPIPGTPWSWFLPEYGFHPALMAARQLLNCALLLVAERVCQAIEARDEKPRF